MSAWLSLALALFLLNGFFALLGDTLALLAPKVASPGAEVVSGLLAGLCAVICYGLMAVTPLVPKRVFMPLALFYPLAIAGLLLLIMLLGGRIYLASWVVSASQVLLGCLLVRGATGRWSPRWPLVPVAALGTRGFSWRNTVFFLLGTVFIICPVLAATVAVVTATALSHYSEGFLHLRPAGLTVQVRKYVNADGQTIHLVPMAHVGDPAFYETVTKSFPQQATILMEGVSDEDNLLTNHINYQRMASALGLAEQHAEFRPNGPPAKTADVDVREFAPSTVAALNLVMMFHAKGVNAETLSAIIQHGSAPEVQEQLWEDILRKRNRHLLQEIKRELSDSKYLIVPWGAAHMPELAREIEKFGFRAGESHELTVISFGKKRKPTATPKP